MRTVIVSSIIVVLIMSCRSDNCDLKELTSQLLSNFAEKSKEFEKVPLVVRPLKNIKYIFFSDDTTFDFQFFDRRGEYHFIKDVSLNSSDIDLILNADSLSKDDLVRIGKITRSWGARV